MGNHSPFGRISSLCVLLALTLDLGQEVRVLYADKEAAKKNAPTVKMLKDADQKIVVTAWSNKAKTALLTNRVDD